MFNMIQDVISKGNFKLSEIQQKVKKLYVLGDIAEAEMDELLALASKRVSVAAERPENLAMIYALAEEIETLKARVYALEGGTDMPDAGYPTWKPWNGISTDYQCGAIVAHNGQLWESVFNGQNVWEPGAVDESFWKKWNAEDQ